MAVLQRVSFQPNERLDTPDQRAIEAFSLNDWRFFLSGFFSSTSYILQGFEISNYSTIFTVPGFQLTLNDVVLFYPQATTQAAGFYVFAGTEQNSAVSLSPNATNFVEVSLTNISGTPDVRAFWDQGANGGAGAEFIETVNTVIDLQLNVTSNITGFTPTNMPLYRVVTDINGLVTSVTDCRNLLFRLGTGGDSPNPSNNFSWPNLPDPTHARLETPITATSATATNAPFQGGDKNIKSMKNWMDAVMSSIKEIKGTPFWYMEGSGGGGSGSVPAAYQNAALVVLTGGTWQHSPLGSFALINFNSSVKRLGLSNNLTLTEFASTSLTATPAFYILLPTTDVALTYVMGQDGLNPVSPHPLSTTTSNTITVSTGGNYITTGGQLVLRNQIFAYTTYNPGTGLFTGVTPDPTGLAVAGDIIYQNDNGTNGYYHASIQSRVPSLFGTVSTGAERTLWIAYYDGTSTIVLREGDLLVGGQMNVGSTTSLNLLTYIGSPNESSSTPLYTTANGPSQPNNFVTDGNNLTQAIKILDSNIPLTQSLRLLAITPVNTTRVIVKPSDFGLGDGTTGIRALNNTVVEFTGAQIDFNTGNIYDITGITLIQTVTLVNPPSGQFQWYSVSLIPNGTDPNDGRLLMIFSIQAGVPNATLSMATKATFVSNGIQVGEVYVVGTGGGNIATIPQSHITQNIGAGSGGGGSGVGNITSIQDRISEQLLDSEYDLATAVDFLTNGTSFTSSTTGTFDVANNRYNFTAAAQNWVSTNLFDKEFLNLGVDIGEVEIDSFWFAGFADTASTYQVSRDGGNNFQTVSGGVTRVGTTDLFTGRHVFAAEGSYSTLQTYAFSNANTSLELNTTTQQQLSQIFTVTNSETTIQFSFSVVKNGTPSGFLNFALYQNQAGFPGIGTPFQIAAAGQIPISTIASGTNTLTIPLQQALSPGSYHMVFSTSPAYASSFVTGTTSIAIRGNTPTPSIPFANKFNGSTWSATTTGLVYIVTGRLLDLRLKIILSATTNWETPSESILTGVGALYNPTLVALMPGVQQLEVQSAVGGPTTFTLTKFLPDPNFLKVYVVETGQVLRYGSFSLNGFQVIFPSGTFSATQTYTLVFDQVQGSGFDNSDSNASLLAANHLGSSDPTIDRSIAGRGVILRRPDGTLRELTIDNSDNIAIYSVP